MAVKLIRALVPEQWPVDNSDSSDKLAATPPQTCIVYARFAARKSSATTGFLSAKTSLYGVRSSVCLPDSYPHREKEPPHDPAEDISNPGQQSLLVVPSRLPDSCRQRLVAVVRASTLPINYGVVFI
jgi:hypothetical protein